MSDPETAAADASPRTETDSALTVRTTRGFLWMGSSQLLAQLFHLGIRIVLARLLAPEAFGLMAMTLVFLTFLEIIVNLGLGAALVHRQDLTPAHRSSAFWVGGLFSLVLCAVTLAGAPLLAAFYRTPDLVPVIRALGFTFLLGFPQITYQALLQRDMQFRTIAVARLAGLLLGGGAGISLAWSGAGVWALVADHLIKALVVSTVLMRLSPWAPRLMISREAFLDLWVFARPMAATSFLNFVTRSLDNVLIGRYLGSQALGFYAVSYQAVLIPLQYIGRPVATVTFPAFAEMQDDLRRCRRAYLKALRLILLTAWPIAGVGIFLAADLVPWVLGPRWVPATEPLRWLSAVGCLQAPMSLSPSIFGGLGRPDLNLRLTVVYLALTSAAIIVGISWGITGVAAAYFAAVLAFAPLQFRALAKLLELDVRPLLGVLARGLPGLAALGSASWLVTSLGSGLADHLRLPLAVALGLAAYAAVSYGLLHEGWQDLFQALRKLRSERRRSALRDPRSGTRENRGE